MTKRFTSFRSWRSRPRLRSALVRQRRVRPFAMWFAGLAAAAILPLAAPTSAALAAATHEMRAPKVVIVVLHGLSWEELAVAKAPALQALLRRAAVGAMNSRPLDSPNQFAPYVSIGAGRPAVTDRRSPQVSDELPTWYITAPVRERMPHIQDLRDANSLAHTQAEPGLLGSLLHRAGRRTGYLWVFAGKTRRLGAAIAMDRTGGVDWMDRTYPGERTLRQGRTRGEADFIREGLREADLLVVDAAISDGLVRGRERPPTPDAPDPVALSLLAGLDPFFRDVAQTVDTARDLLIITSPTCPPYRSPKYISYAPIAIIGPGFEPGLLTSRSTRHAGIVANVDIAPTVLRFLGLNRPGAAPNPTAASISGHPITWRRSAHPLREILAVNRRGVRLIDLQWHLGPVYAAGQFAIMIAVGLALTLAPAWAARSRRRLRIILLLGMSMPLALLFLGPFDPGGSVQAYIVVAGLACALTWLAWRGSAPLTALGSLLSATAAIVIVDALAGGRLLSNCMLNFGTMLGSRFYGIGNETMGVVVACAAIGSAAIVQESGQSRLSMWLLALWLAFAAFVIGAPYWGANWGGGVSAAFAFAVAYAGIRAGRPRLRHWAAALGPAVALGGLAVALDIVTGARALTHVGDSARLVGAGGVPAALSLIARKAHGNLRIMALVPYTWGTLALCAGATWLLLKPSARLRPAFAASPAVWGGLAGGTAGALAAVIVNDSGIVAASTAIGTTALAMAYIALERNGAP